MSYQQNLLNKIQMRRQNSVKNAAKYFRIMPHGKYCHFEQTISNSIYDQNSQGTIRKAILGQSLTTPQVSSPLSHQNPPPYTQYRRIFEIYNQQFDLFPDNVDQPSFVMPSERYYSFLGQCGMLDYNYLKSLIVNQKISQEGLYRYFVKRDGEYYLEQCDDLVPVDTHGEPFWGLSWKRPLQLVLFKMWLNQCKSLQNVVKAPNFKFLQAFGLPQYRVFNFRKQIEFFKNNGMKQQKINDYLKDYTLNKKQLIIICQTINSPQIISVGLIPNSVGYRVQKIGEYQNELIYKVFSCLPYQWSGTYPKNSSIYNFNNFKSSSTKTFLLTEKQVLKYFCRNYVAPIQMIKIQKIRTQDCLNIQSNGQPIWIRFQTQDTGLLSFSIVIPDIKSRQKSNNPYPQIKYFMAKQKYQQIKKKQSYIYSRQKIEQQYMANNVCIQSSCYDWECYRIDNVQGYHNSTSSFSKMTPGLYVMYIQTQYKGMINLRIDSQLNLKNPQIFNPNTQLRKQIFDSTFFSLGQQMGTEVSLNQHDFQQTVVIHNDFQQYGFGSVCIKTSQTANHKVAMKVNPQKLNAAGFQLVSHYEQLQLSKENMLNFVFVSSKGKPQIVVLQRLTNGNGLNRRSSINQQFPPSGSIQFFRVMPNNLQNRKVNGQ